MTPQTTTATPTATASQPRYSIRSEDYLDSKGEPIQRGTLYLTVSQKPVSCYRSLFIQPDERGLGWFALDIVEGHSEFLTPESSRNLVPISRAEFYQALKEQQGRK